MISRSRHVSMLRSCARSPARSAPSPIQCPEPSSPSTGPQPPAVTVTPLLHRPITFDPVPAITSIPGPPWNAASSAISSSPATRISPLTTERSVLSAHARAASLELPASPMQVRSTASSATDAFAAAARTSSCSRAVATSSPTLISFTVSPAASPSTRASSAKRHRVFVPPASIAKYKLIIHQN